VDGTTADAAIACGHVDNARALPTCPQAQHQQKLANHLILKVVTLPIVQRLAAVRSMKRSCDPSNHLASNHAG